MGRVFCTLKEAAAWLRTTEPQLKTMLDQGVLPEFRDGAQRLLRIADVRARATERFSDDREHPAPQPQWAAENLPADIDYRTQEAREPDARLPQSGTALLEAPVCDTGTQSPPASSEPCGCHPVETMQTRMNDYAFQPAWPRPRTEGPRVRKGLWMGIVEDRPSAIITLLALVIGVAAALVGGAYALLDLLK